MIATEGKLARINAAFLKINSTVVLLLTRFLRTSVSRVFILKNNNNNNNIRRRSLTLLCCHVLYWFRFSLSCFFCRWISGLAFHNCSVSCAPFKAVNYNTEHKSLLPWKKHAVDWYRNIIAMPWEVCMDYGLSSRLTEGFLWLLYVYAAVYGRTNKDITFLEDWSK